MKFKCIHCNINITDINKSVAFYQKALGLKVERTKEANDGSFILTYPVSYTHLTLPTILLV